MSTAPKEKACYPLPTVKKLLEQKRKRETSSAPPSCSAASYTAGGAASVPVSQTIIFLSINVLRLIRMTLIILQNVSNRYWHQDNLPQSVSPTISAKGGLCLYN